MELESTPLDHSGKLSMLLCLAMATHVSMRGGCSKEAGGFLPFHVAGGHTGLKAPDLFRPLKINSPGPG